MGELLLVLAGVLSLWGIISAYSYYVRQYYHKKLDDINTIKVNLIRLGFV